MGCEYEEDGTFQFSHCRYQMTHIFQSSLVPHIYVLVDVKVHLEGFSYTVLAVTVSAFYVFAVTWIMENANAILIPISDYNIITLKDYETENLAVEAAEQDELQEEFHFIGGRCPGVASKSVAFDILVWCSRYF